MKRKYCKCHFIRGIHLTPPKRYQKVTWHPINVPVIMDSRPLWWCSFGDGEVSTPAPRAHFLARGKQLEGEGPHRGEQFVSTSGKALLATQWSTLKDKQSNRLSISDSCEALRSRKCLLVFATMWPWNFHSNVFWWY